MQKELLIHYWQLPEELFVSLKCDFHEKFCSVIQKKTNCKFKHCFHKILGCPKWKAKRLFNKKVRFTIEELEKLREFTDIPKEEVEKNLETIGNHEDGTIIRNPKLPFHLKDIFYVASHLMFDGYFRFSRGGYFYSYEDSLTEYHKKRLSKFGEVPINLIEKENQLYFSYTIGYIAAKILELESCKSKTCILSDKFKLLAKKYKILTDEVVKALIIDEGDIEEQVRIELANQKLVQDLYNIIKIYYNLNRLLSRTRHAFFKENSSWNHVFKAWKFGFSASSFKELHKSISPLPIDYKQKNLEFLNIHQTREQNQRKKNETKKLIIESLLENPKSMDELAKELCVKQTTIRAHLKGHPQGSTPLIKLEIVGKVREKLLRRGGYTKVDIFGIKDSNKAKEFLIK